MANLLIGSSNIYRFYKLVAKNDPKPYKMICCTNLDVWNTTIDDIRMGKGRVIISVIENLICDAMVEVTDPKARKIVMEDVVGSFLAQVKKSASENPGVKFALVQPMSRPKHTWYTELHEDMRKLYTDSIKEMGVQNVAKIDGSPGWSLVFTTDGVHLTEPAGKVFVETVIAEAEAMFNREIVDLTQDGFVGRSTQEGFVGRSKEQKQIAERIVAVEKEIERLNKELIIKEREAMERRLQDSLVTARIREEIDFIANVNKEDRFVMTGLTSKVPMPAQGEEKIRWLNGIVGEILDKIEPDASKHIVFTSQGSRNKNYIPLVEVRMSSKEMAMKIRKQFTAKKRENDFGRAFIANSVTLGTRVRIDILKAIAEHYSSDKETMSVSAFVSRPLLHIRSKEGGRRLGTFNFSDALARFGAELTEKELMNAYKRAGSAFKGQMQQNFVVLNEKGFGASVIDSARAGPSGTMVHGKRPRNDGHPEGQLGTPKKQTKSLLSEKN